GAASAEDDCRNDDGQENWSTHSKFLACRHRWHASVPAATTQQRSGARGEITSRKQIGLVCKGARLYSIVLTLAGMSDMLVHGPRWLAAKGARAVDVPSR